MQASNRIKIYQPSTNQAYDISLGGTGWGSGMTTSNFCYVADSVSDQTDFVYLAVFCTNSKSLYKIDYSGQRTKILDFSSTQESMQLMLDEQKQLLIFTTQRTSTSVSFQLKKIVNGQLVAYGPSVTFQNANSQFQLTGSYFLGPQNTFYYFINEYKQISSTVSQTDYFVINTSNNQKTLLPDTCRIPMNTVGLSLNNFYCYSKILSNSILQPHDFYSVSKDDLFLVNKLLQFYLKPLYGDSSFIDHTRILVTQTPNVPFDLDVTTYFSYDLGRSFNTIKGVSVHENFSGRSVAATTDKRLFYVSSPDYHESNNQISENLYEIVCQ